MSPKKSKHRGGGLGFFMDHWDTPIDDEDEVEAVPDAELDKARRSLIRGMLRPYRLKIAGAAAAVTVSTAGVLAIPYLVKRGIDNGVIPRDRGALTVVLVLLVVAALTDAVGQRVALRLVGQLAEGTQYDLRTKLWAHLQHLSIDFFERQKTGRIISRATSDIEAVYELFSQAALTLVSSLLLMLGAFFTQPARAQRYRVVILHPQGAAASSALAAANGEQVGYVKDAAGVQHAFLWRSSSANTQDLHPAQDGFISSVATAVAERGAFLNRASSPSSPPLPSTLRTVSLPPRFFLTSTLPSCTRKASLLASSPSLKMTSPALNVRLGTSPLGRLMRFPLDIEWLAVHL